MAGERILEALELSVIDQAATLAYQEELSSLSEKAKTTVPPPSRNPVFQLYGGISPQEYVLKVVRMIPAASLHDALLVLPFGKVVQLIEHLDYWAHQVRFPPLAGVSSCFLTPFSWCHRNGKSL